MSNRNAQELAESVLSLYDVSNSSDAIIPSLYLPDATFTDPLVSVQGIDNIQAQFRALPCFISSSKANLVRGSMAGGAVLTIDSMMVYRLKPFPSIMRIALRVFTVIELSNGKVSRHTDHWDFYSVFSNLPFVAFAYSQFRPLFGASSSAIIKFLIPATQHTGIAQTQRIQESEGEVSMAATAE
uniref:Uncharacterized protein AlNc14C188G8380 n=1 Tax=Albugo laibachii Nc14 TaxID=890382 RepID=F0WFL6_9STRA|nr:conserved hypothetical protein [Albugo laibachii Nc14]CCA23289.1 conserved hypothetical protein [Albugo laibachii Nc14]|eukprot:CCA23289.1 conserved hypothetical protein [Albugo laibachii Nc14]